MLASKVSTKIVSLLTPFDLRPVIAMHSKDFENPDPSVCAYSPHSIGKNVQCSFVQAAMSACETPSNVSVLASNTIK